ncbi:MAG: hypothetical protein WB781_04720 [Candidatus Sulfotelmatobacter sp.]
MFLPDYFFQLFPHITLADDGLVTQTGQRTTLNEIVLQLMSIPPNCLGGRAHCIWTDERESQ